MDNIQNGIAPSGTQVEHLHTTALLNGLQGFHMSLRKVDHMDIVSHTGAVRCIVVVPEHVQMIQLAHRHLRDVGHQIVGHAVGVLPDQPRLVGTNGVKIPQQDYAPRVSVAGDKNMLLLAACHFHFFNP